MKNAPLLSGLRILTLALNLFAALGLIVVFAQPASAQTETVLFSFCPTGGWCPGGVFFQGNLYGTTYGGGAYAEGTVFEITPEEAK
jgi:uncharacterized repeat protein (TIGR03803 family)